MVYSRSIKVAVIVAIAMFSCFVAFFHTDLVTSSVIPAQETTILSTHNESVRFTCVQQEIKYMKEQDLMIKPRQEYIKGLKNPCWWDRGRHLHCLPYMYLVGVAKCGTTDLFKRITLHPDFVAPTDKEPAWLSVRRFYENRSLINYTDEYFKPLRKRLKYFANQRLQSNLITGEASINTLEGSHFWHQYGPNVNRSEPLVNNAEYIRHLNPDTRILINVRNPVDRLWSEYLAFSRDPDKSPEKFHQLVTEELAVYAECIEKRSLRSCMYDVQLGKTASMNQTERRNLAGCSRRKQQDIVMLKRGVYHVYIRDFLKVFPRDQILVQRLEDLSTHRRESLLNTFQFLGLRTLSRSVLDNILLMGVRNTRLNENKDVGKMLPSTRSLLRKFYKPHNIALAKLLQDRRFSYDIA